MKFTHICLLCVVILAKGEEHEHEDKELGLDIDVTINKTGGKLAGGSSDHNDHDDHADHDHSDHSHADHSDHDHSDQSHKEDTDHSDHDHSNPPDDEHSPVSDYRTWLAASGAILIIALCGIFGILVIPIMQRVFYQHLIQFLIALAVGTLAGDALLHLLPHAFMARITMGKDHNDHHNHDQHQQAVWLGLTAVVSMIGFFFFEKCVNVLGEMKESRSAKKKEKGAHSPRVEQDKKLRVVREGHVASDKAGGERICKNKYSTYCVQDFDLEKVGVDDRCGSSPSCSKRHDESVRGPPDLLEQQTNRLLNGQETNGQKNNSNYRVGVTGDPNSNTTTTTQQDSHQDTVIISEHEVVHHGHSHAHSHIHSAPGSISSVAWMVIFGDGIHNLADGLAIGASFADGYMSGISTSVAVLCHELPHEIGDFAMLLKAGMTIKQAVFYNVLSSILAFIGMVAGLLLGTMNNFSPWMFTATAGIFLYVALVDMMPELSSGHAHPISNDKQHEGHWLEIFLQVLGMSCGVCIMLLIALYEHDLKKALGGDFDH